ncbi:MAG: hypothetical protein IPK26_03600 [Planctomycetes bacterium]|nr:hypothetical protein [Planctomycetota bacterium]
MSLSRDELARIERLRELFLDEGRGERRLPDYWRDQIDLQAYDRVLAARIGWKWDAALAECQERGLPRADERLVVDFGCGSGIAATRFTHWCGAGQVLLHDRSPAAMAFSLAALRHRHPTVAAAIAPDLRDIRPDVLLVSHVLGELDPGGLTALTDLIARSDTVVIVEPGTRAIALRLAALRDRLLDSWHVLAPCPHRHTCPTLASGTDWCHFFATPPAAVFTDGELVRTARAIGIDARSLPYSFLALTRTPPSTPAPHARGLGRAAISAHAAHVQICTAAGLQRAEIDKRTQAQRWRELKRRPEALRPWPH